MHNKYVARVEAGSRDCGVVYCCAPAQLESPDNDEDTEEPSHSYDHHVPPAEHGHVTATQPVIQQDGPKEANKENTRQQQRKIATTPMLFAATICH